MKRSVWCALGLSLLPPAALAQEAPTQPSAARDERPMPTLPAVLTPTSGGLTERAVAARAITASAVVRASHAGTEAAEAGRTEALMGMLPRLDLSARYTRLSPITPPTLNFGGASSFCVNPQTFGLFAAIPTGGMSQCPQGTIAPPSSGGGFAFPVILDQFAVRASLAVPITDIPFRLARLYEAAGLTVDARRFDEEASRSQAALDGRVAFYEYMRARGNLAVSEQGLETVRHHLEDLQRFVNAGTVARVELLRIEAQAAETERFVVMAREGVAAAESQLRIRLAMTPAEQINLGESLDADVSVPGDVRTLIDQAWRERPELASLDRQIRSLDANLSAVRAGYFPSVVAAANLDVANPNQRFIPQSQEFNTTWDATLQVQWSLTGALQAGATASRVVAQREALRAQVSALLAAYEWEVRGNWVQVQGARAAIEAARRQVAAAEESYRVRRERFNAGSAISSDLTDAENDLLRARFAMLNAHMDLRVALARLRRAVGTPEPR